MESKINGSKKNFKKGGSSNIKKNKKTISLIKQLEWLVNNLNIEAMEDYIVFDKKTQGWYCKLLRKSFADIRNCERCMECQKIFDVLEEEKALEREKEDLEWSEEDELFYSESEEDSEDDSSKLEK